MAIEIKALIVFVFCIKKMQWRAILNAFLYFALNNCTSEIIIIIGSAIYGEAHFCVLSKKK